MEKQYTYRLEMSVPHGVRHGELTLDVGDKGVGGTLMMFAHTTDILSGSFEHGLVEFSGLMRTLGYSMSYTAKGKIDKKSADLDFVTEKGTYHAVGRPGLCLIGKIRSGVKGGMKNG